MKTKSCFSLCHKVSIDEARTAKGRPAGAGRRIDHIKHQKKIKDEEELICLIRVLGN